MTTPSSRLLTLLSLMQARRDWPGPTLAERLEVSGRTIRRDVERLRGLGYPVESLSGPAGGYRLRAGAAMPPLLLDDEEATAIAVGLRVAAQSSVAGIEEASLRAMVKLEGVLPARVRRRVRALHAITATRPAPGPSVDPQALTLIAAACRDGERIRFGYRGRDGVAGRRSVEPQAIANLGRRWYLVAWDRDRDDWRTFRVDRISAPAATGMPCTPRRLPAPDAAAFVADRLHAAPTRYEARLIVRAPAEAVHRRPPASWAGTVTPIDAGTCEYRTGDDDLSWLAHRVAMLGFDFEVLEPTELRERLRALADRLGRAAAGRDPHGKPPACPRS